MKKLSILAIACLSLIYVANADNGKKDITSCTIIPQAKLIQTNLNGSNDTGMTIKEGNDLVFKLKDSSNATIYFAVNTNRRFFNHNTQNLNQLQIIVLSADGTQLPLSGEISGFKIYEGIWKVDLELEIGGKKVSFSDRVKIDPHNL